ncbi:hypothetical protein AVEN_122308-1 [Araneus ventricosus]|uniref:Ig-like domain-containing protein n=1 Tax=Araneus ventricosus TaxID=182803 RepID=A0A4Y2LW75_ARAVE|nr:hypothetical protein AVEN_197619-1 [Araneus ventricosus]GBN17828.1 hypothetical protein AVEN_122308-1 [Araneus ventricosus]
MRPLYAKTEFEWETRSELAWRSVEGSNIQPFPISITPRHLEGTLLVCECGNPTNPGSKYVRYTLTRHSAGMTSSGFPRHGVTLNERP